MPTVTTQELVDRAKAAADMRDNFVTPAQWMYWASQERLALDLFIARSGWPQAATTSTYTATGADVVVSMQNDLGVSNPMGIMALVCIHQVENDRYKLLRHQNFADFNPRTARDGHARTYRVYPIGSDLQVEFYPRLKAGEKYMFTYVGHPQGLALSSPASHETTQVNYPMGWEERIVLGMARRALIKEESDTRAIDQEIALWDSRIEEACWSRVLAEAPTVRNTDIANYGWTDRYSVPPYSLWTFV